MSNLNQDILRDIEFALPSLAEQGEVVRRVEVSLALADQIEARCTQVKTRVDKLTTAILTKAFHGGFTPIR